MRPVPENDQSKNDRVQRIDALFHAYEKLKGNPSGEPVNEHTLAWLLADMRCWCDDRQIDFFLAIAQSYLSYRQADAASVSSSNLRS